jgi:UDP-GlcNAc:undecaprenyl-phosphate GlcNAc-1-phosphate transferase
MVFPELHLVLHFLVAALVALAGMILFTPVVIRLAHRFDWLAYPRADRWHAKPTALMGGLAIYAGATLGLAATLVTPSVQGGGIGEPLMAIWGGATLLFVAGVLDDRWGLKPEAKLAAQVIATGGLLYGGLAFGSGWPLWVSLPLTLLWTVGITNAVNLLDNMDGLAAGVAGCAALVLAVFAALTSNGLALALGAAVLGACAGFLFYNFKPARIFMGDCGSLFLGFTIAALGLLVQQQTPPELPPAAGALVPLAVLAVPIFDTTLVTFVRKLAGRPVAQGGRDHASHRLVFFGLSERNAVLALYGLSLLSGGMALFVLFAEATLFYAIGALMAVGFTVLGVHLARADVYPAHPDGGDGAPASAASFQPLSVLHNLFGDHWKAFFGIIADTLLVGAVFVLAHHLRFEDGLNATHATRLLEVLPLVVAVKIAVFYAAGLYRGIWRHAGTPEIIRTVGATLGAALAATAVVMVLYGTSALSLAVICIDWMATLITVMGARFGFRGLRQWLSMQRRHDQRVLLYGAGDAGALSLRELRQNPDRKMQPVGFVDDDPFKQGQRVQGLRVLGSGSDLRRLCRHHQIDTVLVTTAKMSPDKLRAVYDACQSIDVACRCARFTFEPVRDRLPAERPALSRLPS